MKHIGSWLGPGSDRLHVRSGTWPITSPEKGNETLHSMSVDFGVNSKGQWFLKTFFAGCVKVYVWGVVIDFITLALSYPPVYSEIALPTGIGFLSQFCYAVAHLIYAPLSTEQGGLGHISPEGLSIPRSTTVGVNGMKTHSTSVECLLDSEFQHVAWWACLMTTPNFFPLHMQGRPAACAAVFHHLHSDLRTDRGTVSECDNVQHSQVLRRILPGWNNSHLVCIT